jgi:uncharacterized membrane protein YesL
VVVLRLGLRDSYDCLGMVLLMSLLWCVVAAAGLLGGQAVVRAVLPAGASAAARMLFGTLGAAVGLGLTGGPLLGGLFRYSRNAAARREPEVFDLAWGVLSAGPRCVALGLIQVTATAVLLSNGYFYAQSGQPVLVVVGGVFGYLLVFWGAMAQYQWGLLVEQETLPVRRVVVKSALMALDNLGFTLGLGLVVVLFTVVCWLTVIGGALLWAGASAILLTQATRELLRKYELLPPDPTLDPIAEEVERP